MNMLWMAAILDLANMALTARAQLGSRQKSKVCDLGYKWSKFGACGTIWTIKWLSPLTICAILNPQLVTIFADQFWDVSQDESNAVSVIWNYDNSLRTIVNSLGNVRNYYAVNLFLPASLKVQALLFLIFDKFVLWLTVLLHSQPCYLQHHQI